MQAVGQVGLEYSRGPGAEDTDAGIVSMWTAREALSGWSCLGHEGGVKRRRPRTVPAGSSL